MSLTKSHIVEKVSDDCSFTKKDSAETVEILLEIMKRTLESGENVQVSGFGKFCIRDKNERPGRNPKTGEEIPISARRVVTFKPGQKLKARVEAYA